ncbi:type II secretion system F family protein [Hirschia litorea]|uniref:Type II secretion system F family protein n=1 Tax=Hirschia litorea TaxID=1199156 RepID=A0ABW2IK05_9PROT
MDQSMIVYLIAGLAFVSVVGLGFAFTSGGTTQAQQKRFKQVAVGASSSGNKRNAAADSNALRRKQMQDSMKTLRDREQKRRKDTRGKTIKDKIDQAGWVISPAIFWLVSVGVGAGAALVAWILGQTYLVVAGVGFAGALGVPRWILGMGIARRQKKFTVQFSDGIDVIVRGIKTGLPLIECLRIIAAESPAPLGSEFKRVIDSIQMGSTVTQSLERLYRRMPLPEVNFFNIVIGIQQQSGGNLSEALGNLSEVLRSRKMLGEKVKALSSEAKASAMIIGCLPLAVMVLVYFSSPDYIKLLFTHPTGHFVLLIAAGLMGVGIFVMKQMMKLDV